MTWSPHAWMSRRIGVIGAGAIGLSLTAALGQLVPVTLVCRDRARALDLRRRGARVHGRFEGASRPDVVGSVADLGRFGPMGAVFVATKTTAIEEVAAALGPLMGVIGDCPGAPFVVSFQNGIEPGRRLMQRLADPRVLRMVLNYGAHLSADGSVEVTLWQPPHRIGCLDPVYRDTCRGLAALLTAGGLPTRAEPDIEPHVWMKSIVNAAMNPVAALIDASVGEVLDSPAHRIVMLLLDEGLAVARAEGLELGPSPRRRMVTVLHAARAHTPSMVRDVRAGRPSEVGQLNRQIVDHAAGLGVPVPTHEVITALIDAFDWRVFRREHRCACAYPDRVMPENAARTTRVSAVCDSA